MARRALRRKVVEGFKLLHKGLRRLRPPITRRMALHSTLLFTIFLIALLIRLRPYFKYGPYLTEFDPYMQYYSAKYMVRHGFLAWFDWNAGDMWYPFGRSIGLTSFPGVPFTAAFIYIILQSIGFNIPLKDLCVILPAFTGSLMALIAYKIGREVENEAAGLFSALFLAVNTSNISRTIAGFFDSESIGLLAFMLALYFFICSIKKGSIVHALLAGASLGYMSASWGGFVYLYNLIALYTIIMVFIKRYSRSLLTSYILTMGTGLLISIQIPKVGFTFLRSAAMILPSITFITLLLREALANIRTVRGKMLFTSGLVLSGTLALMTALGYGLIAGLSGRVYSVINPYLRGADPLVMSVGEHIFTSWALLYYEFQTLVLLAPLGIYFMMRRLRDVDIFMLIAGFSSLYFASSMIRVTLLLSPSFSILGGIGLVSFLKPFTIMIKERPAITRRRVMVSPVLGRSYAAWVLIIIFLIVAFPFIAGPAGIPNGISSADATPTILTAGTGIREWHDWVDALIWMKYNLPKDAVVASWWDYGYWITVMAERASLIDNATINATQIRLIAQAFMSNETFALKVFRKLKVTHVVVFEVFDVHHGVLYGLQGVGDFSKSSWMIQIAGFNETDYIEVKTEREGYSHRMPRDSQKARESVLYRLLFTGRSPYYYTYIPQPQHFKLLFESSNKFVRVYQVLYP